MSDKIEECDFCGKPAKDVEWLIMGRNRGICSACVDDCFQLVAIQMRADWITGRARKHADEEAP